MLVRSRILLTNFGRGYAMEINEMRPVETKDTYSFKFQPFTNNQAEDPRSRCSTRSLAVSTGMRVSLLATLTYESTSCSVFDFPLRLFW